MGMRGARPYLTETVIEEAEEADEAVRRLVRTVAESVADGRLDADEVVSITVAARRAGREVRDVVIASERASIAQRMADNVMRGGIAESTRDRARHAGLIVPDFQIDMPQDAA